MTSLFGIDIQLDPDADLDPITVIRAWQQAIQGREHWRVDPGTKVVIDTFSFKKIALLRELEHSRERIEKQPVLRALCGDATALLESPPVPSFEPLDEVVSAEGLSLVVPADASQLKAILAVNCGVNLVIQGPPGTGKSQTITNLISTLVASGKRVLFVAEKRQARDVVVDNLATSGLAEVTLHITEEVLGRRGSAASKQDITDQLGEILGLGPGIYEIGGQASEERDQVKGELNRYVRKLHEPLGSATRSAPFDLIGAWAACEKEYQSSPEADLQLPGIREVDDAWERQALEFASRIDDLGESTLTSARNPWLDCTLDDLDRDAEMQLKTSLLNLAHAPEQFKGAVGLHNLSYAFAEEGWDLQDAERLLKILGAVAVHHAARRQPLGRLRLSYWRTKKIFQQFQREGGARAESALATVNELHQRLQEILDCRQRVLDAFLFEDPLDSISGLASFASHLLESTCAARDAITVRSRCEAAKELGLTETLLTLVKARQPGQRVRRLLEMALARRWAGEAMASDPCFQLEGPSPVRLMERLREAEGQAALAAQAAALNAAAPYRPGNMDVAPRGTELWVLKSQINARRRRPLRWLFSHAPNVILQAKPCIVASPLAVAQFLHADPYEFDVVIFDEASQIPTADAVLPISRARQIVVVGDTQQMPPTSFFDREAPQEDDPEEEVYDSILGECETLLPSRSLLWHYRLYWLVSSITFLYREVYNV